MAGEVWEQSIRERDPNQGKYQSSYNASLKTLLNLEEEQERRAILAKDFIKSTEAREAMLQIVSEILTRLDKLALDTAEGCNPENPAKAVKVLEAWARKTRSEISSIWERNRLRNHCDYFLADGCQNRPDHLTTNVNEHTNEKSENN